MALVEPWPDAPAYLTDFAGGAAGGGGALDAGGAGGGGALEAAGAGTLALADTEALADGVGGRWRTVTTAVLVGTDRLEALGGEGRGVADAMSAAGKGPLPPCAA